MGSVKDVVSEGSDRKPARLPKVADTLQAYIYEVASTIPDYRLHSVTRDLEIYDRTGRMSLQIERLISRAQCLADADRILNQMKTRSPG